MKSAQSPQKSFLTSRKLRLAGAFTLLAMIVAGSFGYYWGLPGKGGTSLLADKTLYVYPDNYADKALQQEKDPAIAALIRQISERPVAKWYGQWVPDVEAAVRADIARAGANELPVQVLYNIPHRDCGQHSAGGADTDEAYRVWIDGFVRGIDGKPVVVIVEPDALPQVDCLSDERAEERYELLRYAVTRVKTNAKAVVYLDAGNARWGSVPTMISRLKLAGLETADGFSVNVSNYYSDDESIAYAQKIRAAYGDKRFVIDTSRNGNGPLAEGAWCNPAGRALGTPPRITSDVDGLDAYLWIKQPGTSDGTCNGGPEAGQWWQQNALELARNAN